MRRTLMTALKVVITTLVLVSALGALWWQSLDLDSQPRPSAQTQPADLPFLNSGVPETRGRILTVVTSTSMAGTGTDMLIEAGYELTELSRAYYIFKAHGYAVDVASPRGGRPPVTIDDGLDAADYAFLNDAEARALVANTQRLADVDVSRYAAVYFVGGKGAMVDLANNPTVQAVAAAIYDAGGVVGAVCHGPAALLGARLADGRLLLDGKSVTGFTNEEELFLIPQARQVFSFLLEDALRAQAAQFIAGPRYLNNMVVDGRLITGQNPWSTWSVAEAMIKALGHPVIDRQPTREENAVRVLNAFAAGGLDAARETAAGLGPADKRLIVMHALVALMDGDIGDAIAIQRLAHH